MYTEPRCPESPPGRGEPVSQEVLYRKWRPRRFGDVSGQDPITTTLRHAVAAESPAHAYLFTGPRGTGKTTTGRILAKAVNCTAPDPAGRSGEPCDSCASCVSFNNGQALDLIELDAASNRGIDEIRTLRENAGYAPASARYKVYLIDEVHMLTDAAFNALLKTLEEPPPHVIFVLATTEAHRIPATITSRCQRFDFRRIQVDGITRRLSTICEGEGITVDAGGLDLIARQATGSLRDAVNLLDQLIAYHGHHLTVEAVQSGLGLVLDRRAGALARAAVEANLPDGLAILAAIRDEGVEVRAFMREVVTTLRSLLMMQAGAEARLGLSDAQAAELRAILEVASTASVVRALRALGSLDFRGDPYDALPAEIALASLAIEEPVAAPVAVPALAVPPRPAAPPREARPGTQRPVRDSAPPRREAPPTAGRDSPPAPREAPVPPPPVVVPADEGPVPPELAKLRAEWSTVQEAVRLRSRTAGALLNSGCQPRAVTGDTIELGFRFAKIVERAAADAPAMAAIREVLSELLGRSVQVTPVVWDALRAPAAGSTAERGAVPPGNGGGHLLEEARRLGAVPLDDAEFD